MRMCPGTSEHRHEPDGACHESIRRGKASVRPPRILVVDDDEATLATYAHTLRLEGYDVRPALSAEATWTPVRRMRS
jgi:PleD family two-component response regulator